MVLNKERDIEILAPAGSVESMKAAFHAGADAVYMGGSRFGARAFADNPDEEAFKQAIDYAHIHGKKIYLTMNTLFKDKELEEEAYRFLKPYYEEGLDGIIIQDMGLVSMLRESFPSLPLHGSTQMTITGTDMAQFMESQGLERIVLSRELSVEEIQKIRSVTSMELEVFVQGALCYCYSGQCLMSSFIGGRSGNRGRCAQPCRLPYQVGNAKESDYILSPKDICTLKDIPALVDSGVYSFKIEGRMKKPEYAALTAAMYRYYVDQYLTYGKEKFHVDAKDLERLMDVYNRGGFSGGYLHQHNGSGMIYRERPNHMGVPVAKVNKKGILRANVELNPGDVLEIRGKDGKTENQWTSTQSIHIDDMLKVPVDGKNRKKSTLMPDTVVYRMRNQKLLDGIRATYLQQEMKEKIQGTLRIVKELPVKLELNWKDVSVSVEGICAEAAKNQSMSAEQLKKPILKTGNTPFVFESLSVETDGMSYVANSQLNDLRRNALAKLESLFLERYRRNDACQSESKKTENVSKSQSKSMQLNVMLSGKDMLKKGRLLVEYASVKRVYVELHEAVQDDFNVVRYLKSTGKEIYFALPSIFREKDREKLASYMKKASIYADGWLVRQMETALFARKEDENAPIILDSSIYNMNQRSENIYQSLGDVSITAPVELNYSELKTLGCQDKELTVYGHQTLMVSAQCVKKTHDGCTKQPEMIQLTDRQHKHFYVYNECEYCYNKIYNGLPTMLFDKKKELLMLNPASVRMHFTMESESMMHQLLCSFEEIYVQDMPAKNILKDFTRGHFSRGIE